MACTTWSTSSIPERVSSIYSQPDGFSSQEVYTLIGNREGKTVISVSCSNWLEQFTEGFLNSKLLSFLTFFWETWKFNHWLVTVFNFNFNILSLCFIWNCYFLWIAAHMFWKKVFESQWDFLVKKRKIIKFRINKGQVRKIYISIKRLTR